MNKLAYESELVITFQYLKARTLGDPLRTHLPKLHLPIDRPTWPHTPIPEYPIILRKDLNVPSGNRSPDEERCLNRMVYGTWPSVMLSDVQDFNDALEEVRLFDSNWVCSFLTFSHFPA
ncbi:hypothetical protein FS749_011518 [Ceratobasidium sp. UAMH 11750]|nr:hypothetical protein FS749_011518 [Ceratobasidium sp. UAMH 11750]